MPKFHWGGQLRALFAKSLVMQQRQYKTNACQILFPVLLIIVLFLVQTLVTETIQSEEGKYKEAIQHPPLVPPLMIVSANFDVTNDCPQPEASGALDLTDLISDTTSGQMLYADLSSYDVGQYGPQVSGASFWTTLAPDQAPAGLLGNVTRDVSRMLGIKGELEKGQGNTQVYCATKVYSIPIFFDSRNSKQELDDAIYVNWGRINVAGAYLFENPDPSLGFFNFSVLTNNTLTTGKDLPYLSNLITEAAYKTFVGSSNSLTYLGTKDYPTPRTVNDFDLLSLLGTYTLSHEIVLETNVSSVAHAVRGLQKKHSSLIQSHFYRHLLCLIYYRSCLLHLYIPTVLPCDPWKPCIRKRIQIT
jgi:hypothetical protein